MNRTLVAALAGLAAAMVTPVLASDPPARATKSPPSAAPAAQPAPHSWSGCYLGIEGGDVFGTSQHVAFNDPNNPADNGLPITAKFKQDGPTGGGTVGCNYEINHWVGGIEQDYAGTDASGSAFDQLPFNRVANSETRQNWLDTLRGRVGYAGDLGLIYATAGVAFAGTTVTICNTVLNLCASDSQTRTGWAAGAGVEYTFWESLSLKIEYLHANLGSGRYVNPPVALGSGTIVARDVPLSDNIFRAGLNWRFVLLP